MSKVWCDTILNSGVGKTAGTYDAVGTITLKKGTGHVYGLLVLVSPTAITYGENSRAVLRVDSKDLGISKETFLLTTGISNPPGDGTTNLAAVASVSAEFIPLTVPTGSLDNAKIDISVSGTDTTTAGWTVATGIVYGDVFDADYANSLLRWSAKPAKGGNFVKSTASATSTTSLGSISIPSYASELVSLLLTVDGNAGEANPVVGMIELRGSSIPDFTPQKWPTVNGILPALGVATSAQTPVDVVKNIPFSFPLPQTNFDLEAYVTLAVALTNAADVAVGVRYR